MAVVRRLRRILLVLAVLAVVVCLVGRWLCPEIFHWLVPYTPVASVTTVDTNGQPWTVDVGVKRVDYDFPNNGSSPRINLSATGREGSSICVYSDPEHTWRARVLSVRPVPGGVDVFIGSNWGGGMKSGPRFLIKDGGIVLEAPWVFGMPRQCPPSLTQSHDAQQQALLGAIYSMGRIYAEEFDPVALIQAVNALQAAGQERAVAALRDYLPPRGHGDTEWMHLDPVYPILRLLFIPRDPAVPTPSLLKGMEFKVPDALWKTYPDFPLVVVQGVPFLVTPGQWRYRWYGKAEYLHEYLDYCVEHAVFRKNPIIPETDPLQAAETLVNSKMWLALGASPETKDFADVESVRLQVLAALGRVVPFTWEDRRSATVSAQNGVDEDLAERFWDQRVPVLKAKNPKWGSSGKCVHDRR